jgi:hypothetical protein
MTITADPMSINKTEPSLVTVSFNKLYDGSTVMALDPVLGHIPDGVLVSWTGTINPTSKTLNGM